jgi:hypothetical protein
LNGAEREALAPLIAPNLRNWNGENVGGIRAVPALAGSGSQSIELGEASG